MELSVAPVLWEDGFVDDCVRIGEVEKVCALCAYTFSVYSAVLRDTELEERIVVPETDCAHGGGVESVRACRSNSDR